jgi:glutathione S-transferase
MSIELYVFPPSPRSFKVIAIANHLSLDPALRVIDLRKGDQRTAEYAALNPNMRVPALREGDFVLWESNAIGPYLAGKRPESGLLPQDERARLDVTRWQFWELAHWDSALSVFAFEYVPKPLVLGIKEPDTAAIAKGTELFHRNAKVLDCHLIGRKFVAGDSLTLADFSLGAALILAELADFPIEPYKEIKRWYRTLSALPAWQQTLAQGALPIPKPA